MARALRGSTRREILDALIAAGGTREALGRLRAAMRAHTFPSGSGPVALRRLVDQLNARTQREGLHVLEGWDYRAHRFPPDIAPVLLVDYCEGLGIPDPGARAALAILLDQYFLSLLALLAVRAWDEGDAGANLDRVSGLLDDLHGAGGSGHRVVENAETLLMLAIAYYNPEEASFDLLLRKVSTLSERHRLRAALPCAGILGGHLRWGLRFMYRRDVGALRDDNAVDYPWLLFALLTIARDYARMRDEAGGSGDGERDAAVEGLLNGLSADPWAFTGQTPASLAEHRSAHDELRELLARFGSDLSQELGRQEPSTRVYSPLGFACNFLSNAAVASVAVALQQPGPQPSLNALLVRDRDAPTVGPSAERFARQLMEYSSDPARLDARGAPLIVYDPYDAVHCFNVVRRALVPAGASGA